MKITKFIKDDIHYIEETSNSGSINIYPDPEFQEALSSISKPPLPDLSTTNKQLAFIIDELHLKDRFI